MSCPTRRQLKSDYDGSTERATKDGPWCWANKAAIEKIRSNCEDAKSALGVYFALCEIASDEGSNNFRASHDKIAAKCGLSRQWVMRRLNDLEFIGLVEIFRSETSPHFKMPSAYILLRCEVG
jgi:hypothetical protein